MGIQCCADRSNMCNDEYENMYRELIKSFPKYTYNEFKAHLNKLIIEDNISNSSNNCNIRTNLNNIIKTGDSDSYINDLTFENTSLEFSNNNSNTFSKNKLNLDNFSEISYITFKDNLTNTKSIKLYTSENCYIKDFHKSMIPDWEFIWQIGYSENLIANLLLWIYPHIDDYNDDVNLIRYDILIEIMSSTNSSLNNNTFIEFIHNYLNINLVYTNICILKKVESILKYSEGISNNNKQIKLFGKQINTNMYLSLKDTYYKISNNSNLKNFKQIIESEITKIYLKYNDIDTINNRSSGLFTKQMFIEFSNENNYIWNPLSLRDQYYNYVKNFQSISNN